MKRVLTSALVALLAGVADVPAQNADSAPVVAGNTQFALDLYQQLRTEKGNLFFSPYSISSALAMTYAGARDKTAAEMRATLAFPADDKLHAGFQTLNAEINGDPNKKRGYKLAVANSLWGQQGYPWEKDFLATGKKFYDAGLQDVDFVGATEASRKTINGWVEKQTHEKIKDLLKPGVLSGDTRLVLTNAIYFKGDWASQFKKDRTREQVFNTGTATPKVPMMHQTGKFGYSEARDAQVLRMNYVGKELEMLVVLPKKPDGLAEVEKALTPDRLKTWLMTREQLVDVALPKFKVESEFSLKETLSKLGMPTAFKAGTANFTGMATVENLFISAVIHKAFAEVNEEGTEAAAATAVVVDAESKAPDNPHFVADHPFVFLIRDTRNGSILFLGRYAGPG